MTGWSRLKPSSVRSTVAAGVMLAFAFFPLDTDADSLPSLSEVDHDGAAINTAQTLYRSDFTSTDTFWTFRFGWPNTVNFTHGFIGIAQGSFGNMAAAPQFGVNYWSTFTSWGSGSGQVQSANLGAPPLGGITAQSGTYTAIVAETPGVFDSAGTMNWFASGGASGTAPLQYSLLSFNYVAEDKSEELPGALHAAMHGGLNILQSDEVYRKDISPSEDNYWNFDFDWPNAVSNTQSLFVIFRGTFGNVEGGAAVNGTNYWPTSQSWVQGSNVVGKQFGLPLLRDAATPPGVYTLMVAERNPKVVGTPGLPEADWFASGGASGVPPRRYALLSFDYKKYRDCCSSVAFLPGIEGSVLKEGTNTLWPPSVLSNDLSRLALDSSGNSVNAITVDGILNTFYGTPLYSGFSAFMDGLVASTTAGVHAWEPLPYDWRYGPEKILADGVATPSGTVNLVTEVEKLALDSDDGKVAIVAHSMGGLMGKALIKDLIDKGEGNFVDSFVMVGSPQLGTPQGAASLLHGDDQGIAAGLIVKASAARSLGQNMQSAYNLLPSPGYFSAVSDPVITFNPSASFTDEWRAYWGPAISNYLDFFSFITGGGVARLKPPADVLQVPEVLNPNLAANAANFHNTYDPLAFPPSIRVIQVAGWGIPTVKGIEYRDEHLAQNYRVLTTREGDKTVVYPSAIYMPTVESYYFDLSSYNKDLNQNSQHRDLLSTDPIQNLIRNTLRQKDSLESSYLATTKPIPANLDDQLIVSTHSPVVLGAYDQSGHYTGVNPNQDPSAELLFTSEDIPGSTFIASGDSEYVFLPKTGTYNFVFSATGTGSTTVAVQNSSADVTTDLASYTDMPVAPGTEGTFNVAGGNVQGVNISLDTNNDGQVDSIIVQDGAELTLPQLLDALRQKINALTIKDKAKQSLLKKVDNIQKKIDKQKNKKASKVTMSIEKIILNKTAKGKITDADADEISSLLDQILSQL